MKSIIALVALSLTSLSALAAAPTPLPEPGMLPLLAIGALAAFLSISNKRK